MFYLILAIASSVMVSITMRFSERHIKNNIVMLAWNYVMCLFLAWLYLWPGKTFPEEPGIWTALGLGCMNGFLYLASFWLLQVNIQKNGIVLSSMFMKLGVLVPTVLSVLCFHEVPKYVQIFGFLTALISIVLIQSESGQTGISFKAGLIFLLLGGGSADAMSKIFAEIGTVRLEEQFLLYTFAAALFLCILLALVKKQHICAADVIFGMLIGVPNYFSARFLLKALGSIPAIIAYPTYSVATILVITMIGVFFFREKISRRQRFAMVGILLALILLNI